MRPSSQEPADFVTFTNEIPNGKLNFLGSCFKLNFKKLPLNDPFSRAAIETDLSWNLSRECTLYLIRKQAKGKLWNILEIYVRLLAYWQ